MVFELSNQELMANMKNLNNLAGHSESLTTIHLKAQVIYYQVCLLVKANKPELKNELEKIREAEKLYNEALKDEENLVSNAIIAKKIMNATSKLAELA